MNIRPDDLVLEIGSGHNPHPRADVLVDRYLEDDSERRGYPIQIDRPLAIADGAQLPFRNGTFDYVICSHVLEHVEDPERFLTELARVGARGYIETPSEVWERLFEPRPYHLWFVNQVDGRLVLKRKRVEDEAIFGCLFAYMYENHPEFRKFHDTIPSLFYVKHEWEGSIECVIVPPSRKVEVDLSSPNELKKFIEEDFHSTRYHLVRAMAELKQIVPTPVKEFWRFLGLRRQERRQVRRSIDLWTLLVCPACHGELQKEIGQCSCSQCGRVYPIRGTIPILLCR